MLEFICSVVCDLYVKYWIIILQRTLSCNCRGPWLVESRSRWLRMPKHLRKRRWMHFNKWRGKGRLPELEPLKRYNVYFPWKRWLLVFPFPFFSSLARPWILRASRSSKYLHSLYLEFLLHDLPLQRLSLLLGTLALSSVAFNLPSREIISIHIHFLYAQLSVIP
jgi:hypothetical protein